ncbi:Uncharacterized protein APZ42_029414 [Daphnia magna]|uniref:Uncharacterized protein n=1 Tax=Daphnia magna TaxID=35525 RepID=A0A164PIK8_9CRUS|nr:Uncharacterized protein APZ42_029414 [Daphnia magna]
MEVVVERPIYSKRWPNATRSVGPNPLAQ